MLHVEVLETFEGLQSLKEEWHDVVSRCKSNTVYLTWEWFSTWWRTFGDGKKPFIVLVKKHGRTVTILPLMRDDPGHTPLGIRTIRGIANEYTPHFDLITTEDVRESLEAVIGYMKKLRWDVIELGPISSASDTIKAFREMSKKAGIRLCLGPDKVSSPYIPIDVGWDDYFGGLSKKFVGNLKRREKKLKESCVVGLEEIRDSDDLDAVLQEGFEIEKAGWKGDEGTAVLCSASARNFYSELAHTAAKKDWLSLFFLNANGKRIAFDYSLRYGNVMECNKIGHLPEYSPYSPGNIIRRHILEKAFKEEFTQFNFRGPYYGSKRDWTDRAEKFNEVTLYKRGVYQTLLYAIRHGVKNYLRKYAVIVRIKNILSRALAPRERRVSND